MANLLTSPTVKICENRSTFIKLMNEYQVARFYGPRCECRMLFTDFFQNVFTNELTDEKYQDVRPLEVSQYLGLVNNIATE